MSHVATVQVWRCGWYPGWCRGSEVGCDRDPQTCPAKAGTSALEGTHPKPTLTHAEFLRDYGRCPTGPHGCRVAEQLTLDQPPLANSPPGDSS